MMEYSKIYDVNNSLLEKVNYHDNQLHYSSILNRDTEVLFNDQTSFVDHLVNTC